MTPREAALAITKLEEVSMWANKGIVLSDEQPPVPGSPEYTYRMNAAFIEGKRLDQETADVVQAGIHPVSAGAVVGPERTRLLVCPMPAMLGISPEG